MKIPFFQQSTDQSTRLDVVSIPVHPGLICLRGLSSERTRFELEYALERGSTDNSFLFFDSDTSENASKDVVLVHPPGDIYGDVFLPALAKALPKATTRLKVVVGHVNPNRVELLRRLAYIYPFMELISSNPGAKLIKDLWIQSRPPLSHNEERTQQSSPSLPLIRVIRQEELLLKSFAHQLGLLPVPTPRWPGGLLVFESNSGLLMSDKFFSAHICTADWAEVNSVSTQEERRHFYDSLMSSMATQVSQAVERLETLDIRTIAPGHGPSIDGSWRSLLNSYQRWGEGQQEASLKVALFFASAYGNTAAIADALARGISRTGVRVESLNCEFASSNELLSAIKEADAYLIGSPTLGGHAPTPIVSTLGTLLAEGDRSRPVGIFGSYGWSGEALDLLEQKLRDGGFSFGFEPVKIKFSPNALMVKTLEERGTAFGRDLLNSRRQQQRRKIGGLRESSSDPLMLALGRVVGSLCVLTSRKGKNEETISGAMIASWVSQASFSPPGITISVSKDRAVEALLQRGDSFALNILAEGREKVLMKQFLQPFEPGADRFVGLQTETGPAGQPLIPDALAWLEARVQERMECGDHWVIYAEAIHGSVFDNQGVTAVHHRRTGANY